MSADERVGKVQARPDEDCILIVTAEWCFVPLCPAKLDMAGCGCRQDQDELARQTIQLSRKRESKHNDLAQIKVKILDNSRPSHRSLNRWTSASRMKSAK
jgi:hypothetical protein